MQKKIRVVQTSMDDGSNIHPPPDSKLRRLRWTRQLHDQFIDAVTHLGGAESKQMKDKDQSLFFLLDDWFSLVTTMLSEATPKSVMLMMDVPGLTLYHLKSHLQVFHLISNFLSNASKIMHVLVAEVQTCTVSRTTPIARLQKARSHYNLIISLSHIQISTQGHTNYWHVFKKNPVANYIKPAEISSLDLRLQLNE